MTEVFGGITVEQNPQVSIIVANWEGSAWLARCLSSLQISARVAGLRFELIVVDDASADASCSIVTTSFPRVRLLRNPRNIGFARTVNRGVRAARAPIVLLSNNDLLAKEGFVAHLCRWFVDPPPECHALCASRPLFAVSARTVGWYDGKPNQVCMGAVWKGGRVTPAWADPREPARCLFAQAGAAAYDRELFLKLGGLATFYEPGYWEDYDISWRAAKRGWSQVFDPAAFALHIGGGSMTKRYGAEGVARMKSRNHLLFEAANLRSPRLVGEWALRLPLALARTWHDRHRPGSFPLALADARGRFRAAMRARMRLRAVVSDAEILEEFREFEPSY